MILRKNSVCRICKIVGGKFITRSKKLASGKIAIYPDNVCCLCANEMARERYHKSRSTAELNDIYLAKKRAWKAANQDKIKAAAKRYWKKNSEAITIRRRLKKPFEFKPRKKNAHHRIPTNKRTYGSFDFRRISTMREAR